MPRSFNGTTNYVECGTNPSVQHSTTNPVTVCVFIDHITPDTSRFIVGNAWNTDGFHIRVATNKIRFIVVNAPGENKFSDTGTISTGIHHVAGSYSGGTGGTAKTYVDGVEDSAPFDFGLTSATPTRTMNIGMQIDRFSSQSPMFTGTIGHAVVYDVVLTDNEVKALSDGVSPYMIRANHIQMYHPLYGERSTEYDLSGNRNNGTVIGPNTVGTYFPVGPFDLVPGTIFNPDVVIVERTKSHTTSSFLQLFSTLSHTTSSFLKKLFTVNHTTSSFLQGLSSLTHTTSSLLDKVFSLTHTTSSFLFQITSVDHTTSSYLSKPRLGEVYLGDFIAVGNIEAC